MSGGEREHRVSCTNPVDAGVLTDYWLGALPPIEEMNVEEHLFGCDDCGERLREMIALVDGVRRLAREGRLRMVVSEGFLHRAGEEGLRVREYRLANAGTVQCTVTADDDVLIARLAAQIHGARRVDLYFFDERGVEHARYRDIPVGHETREVIYQESSALAKQWPTHKMNARLVAFNDAGAEVLLGEYIFNHTRSLPGEGTL